MSVGWMVASLFGGRFLDLVEGGPMGAPGAEVGRPLGNLRHVGKIRQPRPACAGTPKKVAIGLSDQGRVEFVEPREQVLAFAPDGKGQPLFLGKGLDGFLHEGLPLFDHQHFFTSL